MKTHQEVIEGFVRDGREGKGVNVASRGDALYSTYRTRWHNEEPWRPLLVRLRDGSLLANGARLGYVESSHQELVLGVLEGSEVPFGVVPFGSIVAAWTDGKIRDWGQAPFTLSDLKQEVQIVVPSGHERWRNVEVKKPDGSRTTQQVHALGDSVVQIKDKYYLSAVDETGSGWRGIYFLTQLVSDQPPRSLEDALALLKPRAVVEAEGRGSDVYRQGEWFAVPTNMLTSLLLADVERGVATLEQNHILGRDGHHRLEEAVVYQWGPKKGIVYARGLVTHVRGEHHDLGLGFRWHRILHNVQGRSYSLAGNFD